MFKKLANLFFEEVEEEEETVVPQQSTKAKPEVYKKDLLKADKPEVEVKSFEVKKEKSIFIDAKQKVPKPKEVVKEVEEVIEYEFTPVISPIRGLKDEDRNTYQVSQSKKKAVPITISRLGTIISPIHGLGKGKNKETFEKLSQMQKEADAAANKVLEVDQKIIDQTLESNLEGKSKVKERIIEEKIIRPDLRSKDAFLTLDDILDMPNREAELYEKSLPHFFIGIKGTGMSALATLLDNAGYTVLGSDTENFVFTEKGLIAQDIPMLPFDKNNIKDNMVVIIGNSFYDDHPEVIAAKNNDSVITYTYHGFLGKFIQDYNSIAVSGSHGKTTTTSMISDMLSYSFPTGHLIGDGRGAMDVNAKSIVIEACEYKRHFISYVADYGIITNLEWDHVDFYHTKESYLLAFEDFANQIKDTVLVYGDDQDVDKLNITTKTLYYGEGEHNDIRAINITESSAGSDFDVIYKGENIGRFKVKLIGRHMIHNALAAIGIGKLKNLSNEEINAGLNNYQGARRRFEILEIGESVVIDDYAHHPTEVDLTIKAARIKYPNHKLVAIYHPDRILRLETFASDYIKALKQADEVAIGAAVDSDGMSKEIDLSVLLDNIEKSFKVEDDQNSISKLAHLSPSVYLFMGTKEMHSIKKQLISYLNRIDI